MDVAILNRLLGTNLDAGETAAVERAIASGAGSIAVGGDASGSSFTTNVQVGDNNYSIPLTPEVIAALRPALAAPLNNLPDLTASFVGRDGQVAALLQGLSGGGGSQAITALRGIGGIGKTELAVAVAHMLALHYPAAQLLIDLRGTSLEPMPSAAVMEMVIRRFEPTAALPEAEEQIAEIYRDRLRQHKSLLILDNARDAGQIRSLLPPAPSAAIVTARRLIELPELTSHELRHLQRPDAVSLLRDLIGQQAPDVEALNQLAEACVDHPLALTVAGRHLANRLGRTTSCADYTAQILANREVLRLGGEEDYDVMASLDLSLELLLQDDGPLAEQWRDLVVFPGDFDSPAANAVWDRAEETEGIAASGLDLERLWELGFLEPASLTGRFQFHDLMRDLAARGQTSSRFEAQHLRHARHYYQILAAANDMFGDPDNIAQGLMTFDLERPNIEAAHAWLLRHKDPSDEVRQLVKDYPDAGVYLLSLRLHMRDWIDWLMAAIEAAREIGDRRGEGNHLGNLGNAYLRLAEVDKAIEHFEQALVISREIGDRQGEGNGLGNLGIAHLRLGEVDNAIEHHEQALVISREISDRRGEGSDLGNLGIAYAHLGKMDKAIEHHEQALVISREIGDRRGEGNRLGNLGNAHLRLGEVDKAIAYHEQALVISREIGDRQGEGSDLGNLGNAHLRLGEVDKAIEHYEQALVISREIGDRQGEGNHLGNLGNAHLRLGEVDKAIEHYEQALVISREIGDRRGEGSDLGNLGNAHLRLGEVDKAIEHYGQALVISREFGDRRGEGNRLGNLGNAHLRLGEVDKAIEYLQTSEAIFTEIGSPTAEKVRETIERLKSEQ